MQKLSSNDIVEQLVADTTRLLSDPAGAPDPYTQALNQKNRERIPVYDLYSQVPLITSPAQLVGPETYDKFDRITTELIITNNQEEAFKLSLLLEDLLYKHSAGLRQQNSVLYGKYEKLMYLCNYLSIFSFSFNEIEALVGNHTVLALSRNINVLQKLDVVLRHYHDFLMEGAIAEKLSLALSKSEEFLGNESIIEQGQKNLPPQVSNWIKDYLTSSHVLPDQQRSGFQRVNYIEKSPNALRLQKKERDILYDLIKIYDWLAYGDQDVSTQNDFDDDGSSDALVTTEATRNSDSENLEILKLDPLVIEPKKPAPPVIPAPNNAPVARKVEMKEILEGGGSKVNNENNTGQGKVAAVLPGYKKPIPPSGVTAEILAAQIEKARKNGENKLDDANKQNNTGTTNKANTPPSKAEQYIQREIDQKLHNLDDLVHKKRE